MLWEDLLPKGVQRCLSVPSVEVPPQSSYGRSMVGKYVAVPECGAHDWNNKCTLCKLQFQLL